jgi:hypothetical protein
VINSLFHTNKEDYKSKGFIIVSFEANFQQKIKTKIKEENIIKTN